MDLKRKLERLRPPPAPESPAGIAGPAPAVAPGRTEALEELRRRMQGILGRTTALRAPAPRAEPDEIVELPFARHETPAGPIYRRFEHLRHSHHVGRMPVDAALGARPEVLALLALDPGLAGAAAAGALYLDTETTGLGGSGTIAFLVGLAWFDEGELVIEQLLLRSPSEEAALLACVAERIEAAALLVTFNGKAFDIPTLSGRYVMNRMPAPPRRPHLDLLHVARRLHRARVGSCTLRAVEAEVLGFVRDADIDGADVAPRYGHFLRTGDESVLRAVVEHNSWDVVSMAALVGLYGEPLNVLHREDLVGLARTYRRARAFEQAEAAADEAVNRGAGVEGLRVRGEIAKARGDRKRALDDFEALATAVDDAAARLELVKLYEHFVKEPARALEVLALGTGELPEAAERRRSRLEKKAELGRSKRAR
jgi:tetratricopeptide (TPR) repeat protein